MIDTNAKEMELISTIVNSTLEQICLLAKHTEKIGGIANIISPEAAIEATRAGLCN